MLCNICGTNRNLDRHHVTPKGMGGSSDPQVHGEENLLTLCRRCHGKIHDGRWRLQRSDGAVYVFDQRTGERVMRRVDSRDFDAPSMFGLLNAAERSLDTLLQALPFFDDDQLVEAFSYAFSFGKRAWLIQAAILYEAQRRSTYGERTLEAIASRFEIGLRQAQKYALVWRLFFHPQEGESVNIDAILLDEPSWYVVAASETDDPESWLAYAQDRKMGDPRYSVAAFRRDIQIARFNEGLAQQKEYSDDDILNVGHANSWQCPWVRLFCTRSGAPVPFRKCEGCEFGGEEGEAMTSGRGDHGKV